MSKPPLPWFKFFQEAWIDGTRDLPVDQRGVYIDCLCLMYRLDGPINKTDDWMAHFLHLKVRKWREARGALVAAGKLVETEDGLINGRADSEIVERAKLRATKSEIAEKREKILRENPNLPLEINDGEPQKGLHARAQSDNQTKKREEDRSSFEPRVIDGGKSRPAQVARFVSEAALDQVRAIAPGWDRQALLKKFHAWPESKTSETDMDTLFLRWARKFTKGRAAS